MAGGEDLHLLVCSIEKIMSTNCAYRVILNANGCRGPGKNIKETISVIITNKKNRNEPPVQYWRSRLASRGSTKGKAGMYMLLRLYRYFTWLIR